VRRPRRRSAAESGSMAAALQTVRSDRSKRTARDVVREPIL